MSYTRLLNHIIFRTKYGVPAISEQYEEILYRYIWGFVKERNSILHRINGMPDHIHLLVELHPTIAVADFVQQLKNATHLLLEKHKEEFPDFYAWSVGYCALSYSQHEKEKIINYIKNQKQHHKTQGFVDEVKFLMKDAGIEIDDKYFDRHL